MGPVIGEAIETFPHSSIGALTSTLKNQPQYVIPSSAFLISPNLLLTAAHNVYDRKKKL